MSVNTSSSSNGSLPHPNPIHFDINCFITDPGPFIFTGYYITSILLLLPLYIFILYLGLQQWWQQRSTSTAARASHSDIFTYHMVAMELVAIFGYTITICGIFMINLNAVVLGFKWFSFVWYGETFFHLLTCVERYLAVVHPITYLSLRSERGIRIRNFSIGCIWLLSIVATGLLNLEVIALYVDFCLLISSLVVISFCSLSVLCVLIRVGPGENGGNSVRVDQSKLRAFYIIMAILGVLLLRCVWNLIWVLVMLNAGGMCLLTFVEAWLNVPSSLVLPLLFLHRSRL